MINKLASVTVLDTTAASADALATAFMVMGEEEAMVYAKQQNVAAYFIVKHSDGFVEHYSHAFKKYINVEKD